MSSVPRNPQRKVECAQHGAHVQVVMQQLNPPLCVAHFCCQAFTDSLLCAAWMWAAPCVACT